MAALFLLAVSLAMRLSQLYFMSAVLVSIPLVSYLLGRFALRSLHCSRQAPEFATEGELLRVTVSVKGHSRLLGPIGVEDTLPQWISNVGGATHGSSRGSALVELATATGLPDENVEADGVRFSYDVVPKKRGDHLIGPVRVRATDPLGLFEFHGSYSILSRVIVFPMPIHLQELRSITGGEFGDYLFDGSGSKGSGIDFHGVREYQPGDELRRVYWKSTARHGRLNVIEFEHSLAQDTLIAIDLRQGTEIGQGAFSSLEYAVRLAAAIASDAIESGSSVRLICAGLGGPAALLGRGSDHLYSIMHALAQVKADQQESLSSVLLSHMEDIPRNSVVVCITSGADEGLAESAEFLRSRRSRMAAVIVSVVPETHGSIDEQSALLAAAGASVAAVECSTGSPSARVVYQHAA